MSGIERIGAAVLLGVLVSQAAVAGMNAREIAGKKLFEQGVGDGGKASQARLGDGRLVVPASEVPCASCHGVDGRGRRPGGVSLAGMRWSERVGPGGEAHDDRPRQGAYDADGLRRALVDGIDPAGNLLDQTMPRYRLGARDLANLQSYLRYLADRPAPGVSGDRIRIGTLLPLSGPLGPAGRAVRGLLESQFARLNADGGIHERQLELVVAEYADEPRRSVDNLSHMLEDGPGVVALLSSFAAGFERELTDLARQRGLPVIAPVVSAPDNRPAANTHVFHLLAGGAELAQVLADYALDALALQGGEIVLLQAGDAASRAAGEDVAAHLLKRGAGEPKRQVVGGGRDLDGLVEALRRRGGKAVMLLGNGLDPARFGEAAARVGWYPELLVPGPFATPGVMGLPAGFSGKVFAAYPSLPTDRDTAGWAEYRALLEAAGVQRAPHATLVASFSGAKLLVEALERAGRALSRESLLLGLEKVRDFDVGLLPPLSYDTTRRIGALGGYVVNVDLSRRVYRPVGAWHRLD